MGDRGTQSYARTGETTEWEDILVKKGVVTREQVFAAKGLDARDFPTAEAKAAQEQLLEQAIIAAAEAKHPLAGATLEELDEAEDDLLDDDAGALAKYREQRLKELKEQAVRERFGEVLEISKAEWVREVTEGSKQGGPDGTWVVVHLYQDRVEECRLLEHILAQHIARRFKEVKFLKIRSTSAVENWPDSNLPALFAYKGGELKVQLLGIKGLGGKGVTPADVEWYLAGQGIVETEMEENPRAASRKGAVSALLRGGRGGAAIRRGYADGGEGGSDGGDSD